MSYGPTATPTKSPLAFDGQGKPRLWWQSGLALSSKPLPRIPKILVDLETPGGEVASALLPAGPSRRLVSDPGRELVLERFVHLTGSTLGEAMSVLHTTEQRSDGLVVWTLVFLNGACDPRVPFSWPGALRIRKLRARLVTPGWSSTAIDLGAAGDGYLGIGSACAIRFVCWPTADAAKFLAAQRLHDYADLVIPNPFPGLGPGEHVLPLALNHREEPLYTNPPKVGPLWFDTTVTNGAEPAGKGIAPVHGWECSAAAAKSYGQDVTRLLSRQGVARVHRKSGEPIMPFEWPSVGRYVLTDNRWAVDPWNWGSVQGGLVGMYGWSRGSLPASTPQVREQNPGPSTAKWTVLAYQPHDAAHLTRFRRVVPAWYFLRSWAARSAIRWSGVDVASSYDLLELSQKAAAAKLNPGRGCGEYQREIGWTNGSVADWLSITPPGEERDFVMAWRDRALAYQSYSCLPNGFIRDGHGTASGGSDNGVPWQEGLPDACGAAAWFQLSFVGCGHWDLWTAGGGATPDVDAARFAWLLSEALRQGIDNPAMPLQGRSPPNYVGTSRRASPTSPFVAAVPIRDRTMTSTYGTPGGGSGHGIHDWTHLALWWRHAKDPRAQTWAMRIGPNFPSLTALVASWKAAPNPWNAIPAAYLG